LRHRGTPNKRLQKGKGLVPLILVMKTPEWGVFKRLHKAHKESEGNGKTGNGINLLLGFAERKKTSEETGEEKVVSKGQV